MIALMYDGLELGTFKEDESGILRLNLHNNIQKSWLPYIFELGIDNSTDMNIIINAWIKERVFPKNRFGSKKMLRELGLKKYDVRKIAEVTRCSVITDPYWLVYNENDTYCNNSVRGQMGLENYPYNSLNLNNENDYTWRIGTETSTENNKKRDKQVIKWGDKELVLHEFKRSHANGGRLEKFWVEDIKTGRQFLIKGSSSFSYEPYSEKIAYIIGKDLGMDVLEYDILPAKLFHGMVPLNPMCKYVSICEKIDRKNYSITSVAEIKRARNIVKKTSDKPITNREVMFELLDAKYIDTMILFDAIIGNVDRHYGNVHILRSKDGKMVGAPLLDNGASLLAQSSVWITTLFGFKVGEWINRSSTMEDTHDKQIEYIQELSGISFEIVPKTIQILDEIQPVLDLMPKFRARAIKKYMVYRLHKYLGLMKRTNRPSNRKIDASDIIKEKEHT